MTRRAMVGLGLALAGLLTLPTAAFAHGLVGKQDLPLPGWLFAWAAAVVLVVSFAALAVLWRTPRFETPRERRVCRLPAVLDPLCGAVGIVLFVIVVYAGFAGSQVPTANVLPTVVFVAFWVGLAVLSAVFGDVFRALNPWRAAGRAVGLIARRTETKPALPFSYPDWLGRWPAALGLLAFVWVELIYKNGDDPNSLAALACAYAVVQLAGMSLFGVKAWEQRGDAFGVYFNLFSRLAPLRWERRALYVRSPLAGAARLDVTAGTVLLLAVMIGTTSFDGFSMGDVWEAIVPHDQQAAEWVQTLGLLAAVAGVFGLYRFGAWGMRSIDNTPTGVLARRFVHTLIPIALAYVVAHYVGLLAYQGQALAYLVSDPLGDGSDLFGTANTQIDYGWIGTNAIWYLQLAALLAGHIGGLALAHDRAIASYRDPRDTTRSQHWMLTVMVGFTCLALWLLAGSAD